MKKIGIIVAGVLVVGLLATVLLVDGLRVGVKETVSNTWGDTLSLLGLKDKEIEPAPVEVVDTVTDVPVDTTTDEVPEEVVAEPIEEPIGVENPTFQMHMLDGEGDAVLLVAGKDAMLINGGFVADADKVIKSIQDLGVKRLKYTVGMNYHLASIGGLQKILSSFHSDYIILADNIEGSKNSASLISYLDKNRLIWSKASKNARYRLGDVGIELLPTHQLGSIVVLAKHGDNTFLVTGTTTKFEEELLSKLPAGVDVYAVNNVNDIYVFPEEVYNQVSPSKVILVDKKNKNLEETVTTIKQKEVELFQTSGCKKLKILSDSKNYEVACGKGG